MKLNKYKLGDLIERHNEKNMGNKIKNVMGISVTKKFRIPTSKVNRDELKNYKIVRPNQFAFVQTTHNEKVLAFAYNDSTEDVVVSSVNEVFSIKDENILLPRYLQIYLSRSSFDRYARYHSWGSARETFTWNDMCSVEIELPDIEIQKKYVAIYKAMIENQKSYERGLEDLKLTCDAYFDIMKKNSKMVEIGKIIEKTDIRNKNNENYKFKGLSMENYFIDSIANEEGIDFSKYKVVQPDEFACVLMKVGRDCRLTVAQNTSKENYIISPAYYTFKLNGINPRFFMSYISRAEFERRAWFSCDTSLRGSLPWEEFCELKIPDVEIEEQKNIADLYDAYIIRNEINEKLKEQIKNICPILIKGSLEEAKSN